MTHFGKVLSKQDGWSVIDCEFCNHAHIYPLPKETTIDEYYCSDFYNQHSPPDWFEKSLREYDAGLWDTAYRHQTRLLDTDLPLLDVGSGLGEFVDYWDRHSEWGAYGIEPSVDARNYSYMPQFVYKSYNDFSCLFRDVFTAANVRASLVLEHILQPRDFVLKYSRFLDGWGRFAIIVPNDFSPLQARVGGDWFVSPVHINYFQPWSLRLLLQNCGLRVIHESATFPMELFILMGFDYRGNDQLGRKVHNVRLRLEKRFGTMMFDLYKLLYRKFGWGRELIFVAENNEI